MRLYTMTEESEWTGLKARIGGWYLNSRFRRLSEITILGDLRSAVISEVHSIGTGNKTLLDVGAGSGYFSLSIAQKLKGGKIVCVDLSSEMLAFLRRRARVIGLTDQIEIMEGNACELPIADSSIDIVICNGVLHELSDPRKAVTEIRRVLKPGGYVLVSDFRDTPVGRRIAMAHREGGNGPFSCERITNLLQEAGIADLKVRAIRHWVLATGRA